MCFFRFTLFVLFCALFINSRCSAQSSVTGCLVDGDTRLYPNSIGNKDPYGGTSIPAYNGTPFVVDNRDFSDVDCDTYYIFNKSGTNCVIYDNAGTVFQNKNGVISEIRLKACNLPLDNSGWMLCSAAVVFAYSVFRKQAKAYSLTNLL